MDNIKHPKRKKDKYNPYSLQINEDKYVLSFVDGEGHKQILEIDEDLYQLFDSFELEDISWLNEMSRHIEHSELTEQSLNERTAFQFDSLEDVFECSEQYEKLYHSIDLLPLKQKRRLILKFFYNKTIEEIAQIEQSSTRAIDYSLHKALCNLRKNKL